MVRPQCVIDATREYFDDQDLFGQWLADCCEVRPGNDRLTETSAHLYRSWCSFSTNAGEKAGSKKAFAALLKKNKIEPSRSGKSRGFKGIRLLEEDDNDLLEER